MDTLDLILWSQKRQRQAAAKGKGGVSWSSYWATLISATVEKAAPTHVVLTFPTAQTSLLATDITATVNGVARVVNSASWTGAAWTVVLASAVLYKDEVIMTFEKTGQTANVTVNIVADYYVRTTGSNTSPYNTPAKAATAIKTVIDYIAASGSAGSIIDIGEGTFSAATDIISLSNAKHADTVISGVGATTILSPAGARVFYANQHSVLKNLKLKPDANFAATLTTENIIDFINVDFYGNGNPSGGRLTWADSGTANYINCRLYSMPTSLVYAALNAKINLYNTLIAAAPASPLSGGILCYGELTIDRSVILDCASYGVSMMTAAKVGAITNSIIQGGAGNNASYVITNANGTNLTMNNNLILGNVWTGNQWYSNAYTGSNNIFTNVNPKFKKSARKGFILPKIDDSSSFSYAQSVEPILAAKGFGGSFALIGTTWNASNNAALRTMVSNGTIEVISHSYNHGQLNLTGKIFDVTKGAETITIDRTADTITLSGGGTVSGFKTKTLDAIKAELEGLGATVTGSAIYTPGGGSPTKLGGNTLGEAISNGAGVNVINLLIDNTAATGYFKTEIKDQIAFIDNLVNGEGDVIDGQTGQKFTCRSFGCPYNGSSADVRLAIINSGYVSGTGVITTGVVGTMDTNDVDMFSIMDVASVIWNVEGLDELNTRSLARLLGITAIHTGLVVGVLGHTTSSISLDQWTWMCEEWSAIGDELKVMSRQQFADYISNVANGWTDDADGTFSRTFDETDVDYTLDTGSPCIGTGVSGVNIGLV